MKKSTAIFVLIFVGFTLNAITIPYSQTELKTESNHISDFETIYCSDEAEYFRKHDKYEGCSICTYKNFCRGCHAVADGLYGNFYKADPQCRIAEKLLNKKS